MANANVNVKQEEKKQPDFVVTKDVDLEKILFPKEPQMYNHNNAYLLDDLCIHAVENRVSDISLQSNRKVRFDIDGKKYIASKRRLAQTEMEVFLAKIFDSESALNELKSGKPLNKSHFIQDRFDNSKYYRFRVNAMPEQQKGVFTIQITLRIIPMNIPYLEHMKLPPELEKVLLYFRKGIALVTGATGSGKSTLLAAVIGEFLRNDKFSKKIVTAEQPIEFDHTLLAEQSKNSLISQSEVPTNVPSFSRATEEALRRAPNIIMIGEARDPDTISEAVTASMTGHEVYTTLHSNGFVDTIRRMVSVFPVEERNGRAVDIISNVKVSLSQQLVPAVAKDENGNILYDENGKALERGRQALREYVIFNQEIVEMLLDGGIDNLTYTCKKVLDKYGWSFLQDAEKHYKEGNISKETYDMIYYNSGVTEKSDNDEIKKERKEIELIESLKEGFDLFGKQLNQHSEVLQFLLSKRQNEAMQESLQENNDLNFGD